MLRSGNQIRFTEQEIVRAAEVGVDLSEVRTPAEYSTAVIELITVIEHERPELLEKIAIGLAKKTGAKLPPKLTSV